LHGRQIHLRLDRNSLNDRNDNSVSVYVGNLAWSVTEEELISVFSSFNPVSCNLVTNMYGRSRGFAIMKFGCEEDALGAISLNQLVFSNRPLEVRLDRGIVKPDENDSRCVIYVGKIGTGIADDNHLKNLFLHIGPIVSAKIQKAVNGRSKGWG
jgi:RNA recognition motif-containing protein